MPDAPILPNPERDWARATRLETLDRREVERRIGATDLPLELLSGGHANLNVRVGADRVLRIFRRDPETRAKEEALLKRGWRSFRTPAIAETGDDFLLIEYVPHGPLLATAEHGASVGRALAEIHQTRFTEGGFLDGALQVRKPFGDLADAFRTYARTELERAAWVSASIRQEVDDALAAHAGALRHEGRPPVLLHGDFKASNLHWTHDGRLLVLDWEFAYAGPALMDVGQLLRWGAPEDFVDAFADHYGDHAGRLPRDWRRMSAIVDLVNLAGLLGTAEEASRRGRIVVERIRQTLG